MNFQAPSVVCRAPISDCDVTEFCDGLGRCPLDDFLALGITCGDPSTTTCDNPDTCDAIGNCLTNPALPTTLCRTAASVCDVDDFCDGLGSCSADIFQPAGINCGDPTITVCDAADTCDGSGACQPNFEPTATVCRTAAPDCDVAEFCDGAGSCPADAFSPLGTACGNLSGTTCDNPDTCDAAGGCLDNLEPSTTVCRVAGNACDLTEQCDGLGACPIDAFQAAGLACGDPSDTICDNPDACDGAGACQSNFESSLTSCRVAVDACDAEDFCDGAGSCQVDALQSFGTPCGDPTATVCDSPDTCDGTGICQLNLEPTTTICRATGGVCDITETCDGAGQCPVDNKLSTECRASANDCDVAEFCDGATNNCPVNAFLSSGTSCGDPTDLVCDGADTCDGTGVCLDNVEPDTTICRTSNGECDLTELCDGLGLCPADFFEFAGTPCGDPTNTFCDFPDSCDGAGFCQSNFELSTVSCRTAVDACDAEEFCDGVGSCPIDAFQVLGVPCGDPTATLCDGPDTCDGTGFCNINNVVDNTSCTDGSFCNGQELCQAGVCQPDLTFCTDACEHCTEAAGACAWCVFDHNLNSVMDGFDFSFFSGCFGSCFLPGDSCFVANYDASPDGCIGGGDFGAFSGCFGVPCGACAGCSGPQANGGSSMLMATSSLLSSASVQLVAVDNPQASDVSFVLPEANRSRLNGEQFSIEVWATHTANSYDGLGSVYVDVNYDPTMLAVENIEASDSFSLFSRGSFNASAGLITAIGGCAPLGDATLGSQSNWVRVATLRMRALNVGYAAVTAQSSYGPFGVSVFGKFGDLPTQQIEFGTTELRIQKTPIVLPKRATRFRGTR